MMKRALYLAMALGTEAQIGCAPQYGHITFADDFTHSRSASCTKITREELFHPKAASVRNVCFEGVLYADSEFTWVVPFGSKMPVPLDVAIPVPVTSEIRFPLMETSGHNVWVVGDIYYDKECWMFEKLADGETRICAPISRPMSLRNGEIVVQK